MTSKDDTDWRDQWPFMQNTPQSAYRYATKVMHGRFPAGEFLIAKDPMTAFSYAVNIIKGRWRLGEKAIEEHGSNYIRIQYHQLIVGRIKR